ncbi:7-deoxyloganetic acid glucosyltransferase-like [Neltuma alba]|uniref:7-deoxyloganetic acid glucosyltransferase-like n=1 Tax=Neltuma alba TaxID=207710 RepID=UPI0010A4F122|nr:7-deoxyloganetic acid glucosyltransferase-like [Prosopis alba]
MTSVEDKLESAETPPPHVVIFPAPRQGHVNTILSLAELLALSDFQVTFLITPYILNRLRRFAGDIEARHPNLSFETFGHGVLQNPALFGHNMKELAEQIKSQGKLKLRELCAEHSGKPRVGCIIVDALLGQVGSDLGDELGVPIIHFRTASACSFWAYFNVPKLLQCNELPIKGEEDMDRVITRIPGMENLVRCRDLPALCRGERKGTLSLDTLVYLALHSQQAKAVLMNTFEDLEGPVLSQLRHHFPNLYTLGPLHVLLNSKKASKTAAAASGREEEKDRTCMRWLDAQPPKSVIYVSFGSVAVYTRAQLMEIWHGLMNSKKPFLWVIRPDLVAETDGDQGLPAELQEGANERACIVEWAPQQEVLEHAAVGGFMTHSGWNSTLESMVAGVPMICWPLFGDQPTNSRYVSEVWKIGLDMKDTCDRKIVEEMVNDLMVERRQEFEKSAQALAALAKKSAGEGGSSYSNFHRFIEYLKSIC